MLAAFAAQIGVALESRTLARAAASAGQLQQANELRTARSPRYRTTCGRRSRR
ncbi:MAG TPA: hypothetical protein VFZ70_14890 [Euzebyales bacterium]